ncbi:MAG: hypothetical protein AAGC93_24305 [Cyanobacteria bacterium P01_F01_bin.53]
MKPTKTLTGILSASLVLVCTTSPASANPFSGILNTINEVNRTIRSTDNAINQTTNNLEGLTNTLGISFGSSDNGTLSETESTDQVLQIYKTWYNGLSSVDQETVSWLVMEHARNQAVTFDTVAGSEWFQQKPIAEQSQVSATFFKLQEIINASAEDRNRFLGFAFCVNGGGETCTL